MELSELNARLRERPAAPASVAAAVCISIFSLGLALGWAMVVISVMENDTWLAVLFTIFSVLQVALLNGTIRGQRSKTVKFVAYTDWLQAELSKAVAAQQASNAPDTPATGCKQAT